MHVALWLLLITMLPGLAQAQERCSVEVIDADTVHTCDRRIRLRTCNAPERFMPGGAAAASRLQALIDQADWLELVCHRDLECRDIFNRSLCDLVIEGEDACQTLIAEGYAKPQRGMRACARVQPTNRRPFFR